MPVDMQQAVEIMPLVAQECGESTVFLPSLGPNYRESVIQGTGLEPWAPFRRPLLSPQTTQLRAIFSARYSSIIIIITTTTVIVTKVSLRAVEMSLAQRATRLLGARPPAHHRENGVNPRGPVCPEDKNAVQAHFSTATEKTSDWLSLQICPSFRIIQTQVKNNGHDDKLDPVTVIGPRVVPEMIDVT
uniref:Uncharacterized protein n=1 Tax=Coccidioides posadasii RMSCC 3488 TaxID=454284 RepID=A0A0J6F834_COCPO|nr:hypothetical protein CPAG_02677 [Coccidioides posadasii RMSCC 3488]